MPSQSIKARAMLAAEAPQTLAQWLDLPAGWIAEPYIATVELHWPRCLENNWTEQRATIARPYRTQTREWWLDCARTALASPRSA
jgi:hypothetical protein